MHRAIPLPFRLEIPEDDSFDLSGVRSISYEVDGLLQLGPDALTFEWVARRRTKSVGFTGVKQEMDESPIGRVEIPYHLITHVRLRGWWFAPRLDLYGSRLDTFDRVPGAHGSVLTLGLRRQDRVIAAAIVRAVDSTRATLPPPRGPREIEGPE